MLSFRISNFVANRSSHQDVREGRTAKTGKTGGWEECNALIIALQTLRRLGKKAKCKSQPKTLDWVGGDYRLLFNEKFRKWFVFQLIEKAERKLHEISAYMCNVKRKRGGNEKAKENMRKGKRMAEKGLY